MSAFVVITGLTTGNFLYQALGDMHWAVAAERTFFETSAILGYIVIQKVLK